MAPLSSRNAIAVWVSNDNVRETTPGEEELELLPNRTRIVPRKPKERAG
jgi:hypothetical protein